MDIQPTIFKQSDWETLYKRSEYSKEGKHFPLHYLLALNQSEKTVLEWVDKLKAKKSPLLTKVDTNRHSFTPLIIACMRGKIKVVQAILACFEKPSQAAMAYSQRDSRNWSALDHSAVSSKEIYTELLKLGSDTQAVATSQVLYKYTHLDIKPFTSSRVYLERADGTMITIEKLSPGDLQREVGLENYRDIPYFPPKFVKKLWEESDLESAPPAEAYVRFKENPPKLKIRTCEQLKGKVPHPHELAAEEDIPPYAVISEYSGEVNDLGFKEDESFLSTLPTRLKNNVYQGPDIDAQKIGNASRVANWGWPNAALIPLKVDRVVRNILICIKPGGIKKGEPVQWDYGANVVELGLGSPMVLLGRDEMRAHFKPGLKHLLSEYKKLLEKEDPQVDFLTTCLSYPMCAPGALLDLHFSGVVHVKEWRELFYSYQTKYDFVVSWIRTYDSVNLEIRSFVYRVEEFENALSNSSKETKEAISKWVLDRIGKYSVLHLLYGFEQIKEQLKNSKEPIEWSSFLNELDKKLDNYDYTEDTENSPLGRNRLLEDSIQYFKKMPVFKEVKTCFLRENLRQLEVLDENAQGKWVTIKTLAAIA